MVIEVGLILAFELHPEWSWRIQVFFFDELWKHLKLISIGAVKQLPKTERIEKIALVSSQYFFISPK